MTVSPLYIISHTGYISITGSVLVGSVVLKPYDLYALVSHLEEAVGHPYVSGRKQTEKTPWLLTHAAFHIDGMTQRLELRIQTMEVRVMESFSPALRWSQGLEVPFLKKTFTH